MWNRRLIAARILCKDVYVYIVVFPRKDVGENFGNLGGVTGIFAVSSRFD